MTEQDKAYAEALQLEALLPEIVNRLHQAAMKLGSASDSELAEVRAEYQTVADELSSVQKKRALALKLSGK